MFRTNEGVKNTEAAHRFPEQTGGRRAKIPSTVAVSLAQRQECGGDNGRGASTPGGGRTGADLYKAAFRKQACFCRTCQKNLHEV